MCNVYFTSDLHFGHKRIIEFSGIHGRIGSNSNEHDEWIIDSWNSLITKRDIIWILGDIAIGKCENGLKNLSKVGRLYGIKNCVLGNHDELPIQEYSKYFHTIKGFTKYKGYWLSHVPIHSSELRGKKNIHGHIHHNIIEDENYINVCIEANLKRTGTIFTRHDQLLH